MQDALAKNGPAKTRPMKCEGQKPPEGNSYCGGTGRRALSALPSCRLCARFLTIWKTFIVQCSYVGAAKPVRRRQPQASLMHARFAPTGSWQQFAMMA